MLASRIHRLREPWVRSAEDAFQSTTFIGRINGGLLVHKPKAPPRRGRLVGRQQGVRRAGTADEGSRTSTGPSPQAPGSLLSHARTRSEVLSVGCSMVSDHESIVVWLLVYLLLEVLGALGWAWARCRLRRCHRFFLLALFCTPAAPTGGVSGHDKAHSQEEDARPCARWCTGEEKGEQTHSSADEADDGRAVAYVGALQRAKAWRRIRTPHQK